MKRHQPANKPANLTPLLPKQPARGLLRDLAGEVRAASARLEGRLAPETALRLGDELRLLNSFHSNLIEGHKTSIPDIRAALSNRFDRNADARYAQELCAAHVNIERQYMTQASETLAANICETRFLCDLHADFYALLPEPHRFTHSGGGFTNVPVRPGDLRDVSVSVDGQSAHGPPPKELVPLMARFAAGYTPSRYHGDDRLIAVAASHHRLTWLHPFRDGNGRVTRLFSGLYLAAIGVNRSNLWSLSRGLSRQKKKYMFELWATDSPDVNGRHQFDDDLLADFIDFFLNVCLDQVVFMEKLLRLDGVESRIDEYVAHRNRLERGAVHPDAARLLRAVFMRGKIARGEASTILNTSERSARRVVSSLLKDELLSSSSHRAPLTISFPDSVLPFYFPGLYDPAVIGT